MSNLRPNTPEALKCSTVHKLPVIIRQPKLVLRRYVPVEDRNHTMAPNSAKEKLQTTALKHPPITTGEALGEPLQNATISHNEKTPKESPGCSVEENGVDPSDILALRIKYDTACDESNYVLIELWDSMADISNSNFVKTLGPKNVEVVRGKLPKGKWLPHFPFFTEEPDLPPEPCPPDPPEPPSGNADIQSAAAGDDAPSEPPAPPRTRWEYKRMPQLPCPVCGKRMTMGRWKRHVQTHRPDRPYKCSKCGRYFFREKSLWLHEESAHRGIKPYRCEICGLAVRWVSTLKIHVQTHSLKKSHHCKDCGLGFTSVEFLEWHNTNPGACDIKKEMVAPGLMSDDSECAKPPPEPAESHDPEPPPEVAVSGSADASSAAVGDDAPSEPPPPVPEVSANELAVTTDPCNQPLLPHKCRKCWRRFPKQKSLWLHDQSVHNGTKPYLCELCGLAFRWLSELKRHKREHALEKIQHCKHCGLGFSNPKHFEWHNAHPEQCDRDQVVVVRGSMSDHTGYTKPPAESNAPQPTPQVATSRSADASRAAVGDGASSEPPAPLPAVSAKPKEPHGFCPICGRAIWLSRLRRHIEMHRRERTHKCGACPASFYKEKTLRLHVQTAHNGVKHQPYRIPRRTHHCKDCGLGFSSVELLEWHNTHLGACDKKIEVEGSIQTNNHSGYTKPPTEPAESNAPQPTPQVATSGSAHASSAAVGDDVSAEPPAPLPAVSVEQHAPCPTCGAMVIGALMQHHICSLKDNGPYKCSKCRRHFYEEKTFRLHEESAHQGAKPFFCKVCGMPFRWVSTLKIHIRSHSLKKTHRCEGCGFGFSTPQYLEWHKAHSDVCGEKQINKLCAVDIDVSYGEDIEGSHEATAFGISLENGERMYNEGVDAVYSGSLSVPPGKGSVPDDPSNSADGSESSAAGMATADAEKEYRPPPKCLYCGALRPGRLHLESHWSVEDGAAVYKCSLCTRAFGLLSRLQLHLQVVHLGEEEAEVCEVCGEAYARTIDMDRHRQIHADADNSAGTGAD